MEMEMEMEVEVVKRLVVHSLVICLQKLRSNYCLELQYQATV